MTTQTDPQTLTDLEIRIFRREEQGYPVEMTLGGQQEFPRGYMPADIATGVADGRALYDALLADAALRGAWGQARGSAPQRRIRLRIDADAPELHALPWELVEEESIFLAADAATPFSRYLAVSSPWGQAIERRPIRVLAVIANPADLEDLYNLAPLDMQAEQAILRQAFAELDAQEIVLDVMEPPATLERIEARLRKGYHILHYVGHGVFNKRRGQAALYMQDDGGNTHIVHDDDMVGMLARQGVQPRLIFLAACQSATRATANAFLGLGPKLVAAGVPAVIAMQDRVAVQTAQKLSLVFYQRLAEHGTIDLAMNEVRGALLTAGKPDAAVPVLFMRLQSGQLWQVEPATESVQAQALIPPPPEPDLPPDVSGFVGREAELAFFVDKLKTSRLAIITGMPGVGKTMLASVLAQRAAAPQNIFWHTFYEHEGIEYLIWKLAGFLYWRGRPDLWNMLQGARSSGSQLPPAGNLMDYLVQLLRDREYVLCLDDADLLPEQDCAALIGPFVQRLTSQDISFVVASQSVPEFAQPGQSDTLSGLSLEDTLTFLAHHGLPVEQGHDLKNKIYETSALSKMGAQELMSGEIAANLHARTEGNPLFLTLAVDALRRTAASVRPSFIVNLFMDDNIERFLMKKIDEGLTEDERAVMSAIAVLLGEAGARDAIEAILEGRSIRRILAELSERRLLNVREGEAGREYSLNTLVRYFYYDMLSKSQRQAMHRRAAVYYETGQPDILRAARHFAEAGEIKKSARLAADNVWGHINQGHARSLHALLECFSADQFEPEQWARINLAVGQTLAFLGQSAAAQLRYEAVLASLDAMPLIDSKMHMLRAEIVRWLAELHYQQGDYAAALARVREGLNGPNAPRAELTLLAAHVYLRQGDYENSQAQAQASLEMGQTLGQASITARASSVLGHIETQRGHNRRAVEYFEQSLQLYRQLGDVTGQAKTHNVIGAAYFDIGQWSRASECFQQSRQIFERLGNVHFCVGLDNNLGFIALRQGRLDEALSLYQSNLERLEQAQGSLYVLGLLHASLGDTFIRRGDAPAARQHLRRSLQYCEQTQARDFLPELYRLQAEAALLAQSAAEAESLGRRSLALARELDARGEEGRTLRVLGEALLALGRLEQAQTCLDQSVSILKEMSDDYEWARSQLSLARAHGAQARRNQALAALELCAPVFERLEAKLDLDAARILRKEMEEPA